MLLFSRQGKLRLQKWYNPIPQKEKRRTTRELITLILSRKPKMCSFLEYRDQKIVYKRYASLFFCVAIDPSDNELLTLEVIHRYTDIHAHIRHTQTHVAHTHTYAHTCKHTQTYINTGTHTYAHTLSYTHTYVVQTLRHTHIRTYTQLHTHVQTLRYTHRRTQAHTTHTQMHSAHRRTHTDAHIIYIIISLIYIILYTPHIQTYTYAVYIWYTYTVYIIIHTIHILNIHTYKQTPCFRYVELLDKYFGSVCELDIIFNFEKAYFVLDELLIGGEVQVGDKVWIFKSFSYYFLTQFLIDHIFIIWLWS